MTIPSWCFCWDVFCWHYQPKKQSSEAFWSEKNLSNKHLISMNSGLAQNSCRIFSKNWLPNSGPFQPTFTHQTWWTLLATPGFAMALLRDKLAGTSVEDSLCLFRTSACKCQVSLMGVKGVRDWGEMPKALWKKKQITVKNNNTSYTENSMFANLLHIASKTPIRFCLRIHSKKHTSPSHHRP